MSPLPPAHLRTHDQFIILPPGSIMTFVRLQQFVCVTTLTASPHWYYDGTLLPSYSISQSDSFISLFKTGNYSCSIGESSNYTVTLTKGLCKHFS